MAAISVAFVFFLLISCTNHKGRFLLINQAKEPIARALVTVFGQTIELNDVQPGDSASGYYEVKSDSNYRISIAFTSGKILKKELGYVTNGLDFYHEILVTDANIEISNDSTKF